MMDDPEIRVRLSQAGAGGEASGYTGAPVEPRRDAVPAGESGSVDRDYALEVRGARSVGLLMPQHVARTLPAMVRHKLATLSAERQSEFLEMYLRRTKSMLAAYLLWVIGLHYAYLGRWGHRVIFWLSAGGLFIWWLVDLFRIPSMIARYNEDVALNVMRDLIILAES